MLPPGFGSWEAVPSNDTGLPTLGEDGETVNDATGETTQLLATAVIGFWELYVELSKLALLVIWAVHCSGSVVTVTVPEDASGEIWHSNSSGLLSGCPTDPAPPPGQVAPTTGTL